VLACNVVQKLPLAAVHGFTKFSPKAKETKLELIYKKKITEREREKEKLGMNISNNENPWQVPQVANKETMCTSKPSKNTFSHSPSLALTTTSRNYNQNVKQITRSQCAYTPLVLTLANHLINIPCSTWNISP
jgi:hypothetical protein